MNTLLKKKSIKGAINIIGELNCRPINHTFIHINEILFLYTFIYSKSILNYYQLFN